MLSANSLISVPSGLKNLLRSNNLGALDVFGLDLESTKYRQCVLPFNCGAI